MCISQRKWLWSVYSVTVIYIHNPNCCPVKTSGSRTETRRNATPWSALLVNSYPSFLHVPFAHASSSLKPHPNPDDDSNFQRSQAIRPPASLSEELDPHEHCYGHLKYLKLWLGNKTGEISLNAHLWNYQLLEVTAHAICDRARLRSGWETKQRHLMRHAWLTLSTQSLICPAFSHIRNELLSNRGKKKALKIPLITVQTLTIRFVCTFLRNVSKNGWRNTQTISSLFHVLGKTHCPRNRTFWRTVLRPSPCPLFCHSDVAGEEISVQ